MGLFALVAMHATSVLSSSNQKNYNRQMAEGYIMYMMAGSYFKDGKALGSCFFNMFKLLLI